VHYVARLPFNASKEPVHVLTSLF